LGEKIFQSLQMEARAPEAIKRSIQNRTSEEYSVHDALPYLVDTARVTTPLAGQTDDEGVVSLLKFMQDKLGLRAFCYEQQNSGCLIMLGNETGAVQMYWDGRICEMQCVMKQQDLAALSDQTREILRVPTKRRDEGEPVFCINSEGRTFELGYPGTPLVHENYSDKQVAQYNRAVDNLNTDQPSGRLTLLQGEPGTGKTYMIRGMIQQCFDRKFVLLTGDALMALGYSSVLEALLMEYSRGDRFALIVEDGDRFVAPRQLDNVTHVSTLLNATDGILADSLDLHVIVSTNCRDTEVDPALVRSGRLGSLIQFGRLSPSAATDRLRELDPESTVKFERPVTLAEIYASRGDE
jgi:hypothetical protein